jgi:hypothetical protein
MGLSERRTCSIGSGPEDDPLLLSPATGLLRREGEPSGINRVHRLYREEGLAVRKRRTRRKAVGVRVPILLEARPNARWPGLRSRSSVAVNVATHAAILVLASSRSKNSVSFKNSSRMRPLKLSTKAQAGSI